MGIWVCDGGRGARRWGRLLVCARLFACEERDRPLSPPPPQHIHAHSHTKPQRKYNQNPTQVYHSQKFLSSKNARWIKCSLKASEGLLYPLDKARHIRTRSLRLSFFVFMCGTLVRSCSRYPFPPVRAAILHLTATSHQPHPNRPTQTHQHNPNRRSSSSTSPRCTSPSRTSRRSPSTASAAPSVRRLGLASCVVCLACVCRGFVAVLRLASSCVLRRLPCLRLSWVLWFRCVMWFGVRPWMQRKDCPTHLPPLPPEPNPNLSLTPHPPTHPPTTPKKHTKTTHPHQPTTQPTTHPPTAPNTTTPHHKQA